MVSQQGEIQLFHGFQLDGDPQHTMKRSSARKSEQPHEKIEPFLNYCTEAPHAKAKVISIFLVDENDVVGGARLPSMAPYRGLGFTGQSDGELRLQAMHGALPRVTCRRANPLAFLRWSMVDGG